MHTVNEVRENLFIKHMLSCPDTPVEMAQQPWLSEWFFEWLVSTPFPRASSCLLRYKTHHHFENPRSLPVRVIYPMILVLGFGSGHVQESWRGTRGRARWACAAKRRQRKAVHVGVVTSCPQKLDLPLNGDRGTALREVVLHLIQACARTHMRSCDLKPPSVTFVLKLTKDFVPPPSHTVIKQTRDREEQNHDPLPSKHAFDIELANQGIFPELHIWEFKMHKHKHVQTEPMGPWEKEYTQPTECMKIKPMSPKYSLSSK